MNILIIEDENLAVDKLRQVLDKVRPDARIVGIAGSIASSVDWLIANNGIADLILMDIELADGQSFAIFDKIAITCPVIFVTSYDEYALKAFKVNSVDYLLKPIQQDELRKALEKFEQVHLASRQPYNQFLNIDNLVRELQKQVENREYRKRFLVKHLQRLIPVDISAISYFFYEDRVTFFRTFDDKRYMVDYTLDEIEDMVDPSEFFRISRSLIVSVKSIDQIHPYFGNRLALRLVPVYEKETVVSREKVNAFKDWIGR